MRDLFRDTVLNVNARDYTEEEVKDWTSCWKKTERWKELLLNNQYVGAFDKQNVLVGFASMNKGGDICIQCLCIRIFNVKVLRRCYFQKLNGLQKSMELYILHLKLV